MDQKVTFLKIDDLTQYLMVGYDNGCVELLDSYSLEKRFSTLNQEGKLEVQKSPVSKVILISEPHLHKTNDSANLVTLHQRQGKWFLVQQGLVYTKDIKRPFV